MKKGKSSCKYNFPCLPSNYTIISMGHDCDEYQELSDETKKSITETHATVKKHLQESGDKFTSLDQVLIEMG